MKNWLRGKHARLAVAVIFAVAAAPIVRPAADAEVPQSALCEAPADLGTRNLILLAFNSWDLKDSNHTWR